MNDGFLKSIAGVLENAGKDANAAINSATAYAYVEIGRVIVEEERRWG